MTATDPARLAEANPDTSFTLSVRGWPESALALVPDGVEVVEPGE